MDSNGRWRTTRLQFIADHIMTSRRAVETIFSVLALLVLSPVLLTIAALIVIHDGSSALYLQHRAGRNGLPFQIIKLRTMVPLYMSGADDTVQSRVKRVTRIGTVLRSTKFDETLQLMNVLFGNMSIVGPRPDTLLETTKYSQFFSGVLRKRPGITDWASVLFRNEEVILATKHDPGKFDTTVVKLSKMKLAYYYVKVDSLMADCLIVIKTILSVTLRGE